MQAVFPSRVAPERKRLQRQNIFIPPPTLAYSITRCCRALLAPAGSPRRRALLQRAAGGVAGRERGGDASLCPRGGPDGDRRVSRRPCVGLRLVPVRAPDSSPAAVTVFPAARVSVSASRHRGPPAARRDGARSDSRRAGAFGLLRHHRRPGPGGRRCRPRSALVAFPPRRLPPRAAIATSYRAQALSSGAYSAKASGATV